MQFLKEHGYGGVIIWSLDLDDKTGEACNEGPFPIFNAAKRELMILPDHLLNINNNDNNDNETCSEQNRTVQSKQLQSNVGRRRPSMMRIENEISFNHFVFFYFRFFLSFLPGVCY